VIYNNDGQVSLLLPTQSDDFMAELTSH
jgi:hypothetical protein